MYLEIPVDVAQFNADGDKIKTALASSASVIKDNVQVLSSQEYPMSELSSSSSTVSSSPPSSGSSPSPSPPAPPADSTSSYCTAPCGPCSEIPDFNTMTECNYNIYQSCCNTRRRSTDAAPAAAATAADRRVLASTNSANPTSSQHTRQGWIKEGDSTSTGSGGSSSSTGGGECTPEPPAGADKFTVAEVEVRTTVGRVDDTWRKLNEYGINKEMADKCLYPVVVKYEGVAEGGAGSAGSMLRSSWRLGALALSVALTAALRF